MVVDQATIEAGFDFRRYAMKPRSAQGARAMQYPVGVKLDRSVMTAQCRLIPRLRTYCRNTANRRFGPIASFWTALWQVRSTLQRRQTDSIASANVELLIPAAHHLGSVRPLLR